MAAVALSEAMPEMISEAMSVSSSGASEPDLPLPPTVHDAEELIRRFYQPGAPKDFERIDRCLKQLQKSDRAYKFADLLMDSKDPHVCFFAALTFVVKINRDWDALSERQAEEMLQRLLVLLFENAARGGRNLVTRKLCAALAAIFVRTGARWDACVGHVVVCLRARGFVEKPALGLDLANAVRGLEPPLFIAALWFATIVTEEVGGMSAEDAKSRVYVETLQQNVPVMVQLVEHGIAASKTAGWEKCVTESIRFFHSMVSHLAAESSPDVRAALQGLLTKFLKLLLSNDFLAPVAEMACDILATHPSFVLSEHLNVIFRGFNTDADKARMEVLDSGSDDPDALAYARVCLAFGEATMESILRDPHNLDISQFMERMCRITGRPGTPLVSDELAAEMLEFWAKYVEAAEDYVERRSAGGKDPHKAKAAVAAILARALDALLRKIQLPSPQEWALMDSADKTEFHGYRRDFQHLLAAYHSFFGLRVLDELGRHVTKAKAHNDWASIEAALFAISGIADAAVEDEHMDESLSALFGSVLWEEVTQPDSAVPAPVRNTAVSLVAAYQGFFRRNVRFLEPTLVFLFRCLDHPPLTPTAARTIAALCDACRAALAPHAQTFVDQYKGFLRGARREPAVKERVAAAVAAVIQGQSMSADPERRKAALQAFHGLLTLIEDEVMNPDRSAAEGASLEQFARDRAVESMCCLAAVGKSSRAPDQAPIDLEGSRSASATEEEVEMTTNLRTRVVDLCTGVVQHFADDREIVEAVCNVLRAGIPEENGPFMLSAADFEATFRPMLLRTSCSGMALETIGRFLRKKRNESKNVDVQRLADAVFRLVLHMVTNMRGDPSVDTEAAASAIDFVQTYIPSYLSILCRTADTPAAAAVVEEALQFFWLFTTTCLATAEILPRRAAAAFWAAALEARPEAAAERAALDARVQTWAPRAAQALANGVGGDAPRSELDALVPPLRRMCAGRPEAARWLGAALADSSFPSERVSERDKSVFLQTILKLRGGAKTGKVVKEFWVQCRGTFAG